jgi:hypothetical protein
MLVLLSACLPQQREHPAGAILGALVAGGVFTLLR